MLTSALGAALTALAAERQQLLGHGLCIMQSAGQEVGCAQVGPPLRLPASIDAPRTFHCLLEERQGLCQAPRHSIYETQRTSGHGVPGTLVRRMHRHGALKPWYRVVEAPLLEEGFTVTQMGKEETTRLLEGFGDAQAFLSGAEGLLEVAECTQAG